MSAVLWDGPLLSVGSAADPLLPKLIKAINQATEIEISVSFVQPSGLQLLLPALQDALASGCSLSILTSDYLLITSPLALRQLLLLTERGASIKVFCCQPDVGFHMKAYIFTRKLSEQTPSGCAYIGSSNISKAALTQSHEWSLRYQYIGAEIPADFAQIRQQFAAIFAHSQSQVLDETLQASYSKRYQAQQTKLTVTNETETEPEFVPNSAQQDALAALAASRQNGFQRGLVVLATGMGKTWLAAFDAKQMAAKRVLFVAHREEILVQAQQTFSWLNPGLSSGLYLAEQKHAQSDLLFASVQTLSKAAHLERFSPEHFDYLVIDEFHHAVGSSYQAILSYFQPRFLLGLTATPERTDQADILALCDHNLVYSRNLVHGIEDTILVPFHYYGIYDPYVNYQEIPWRHGRFDPAALDAAFATRKRAAHIFKHWQQHKQSRTLAFCMSRKHADFMAEYFVQQGIAAAAVYQGSELRRNAALSKLEQGELTVIFSVDLFNEGTDLPSIDTLLMLRPTESKILFLQQLGRGLRQSTATGKQFLQVLDFIGNHRAFLLKPATLFNHISSKTLVDMAENPPELAAGCYINFAPEVVQFWQQLVKTLRNSAAEDYQTLTAELGHWPTAVEFFAAGYDFSKVRKQHGSWFELVVSQQADPVLAAIVQRYRLFLLRGVESTAMTKSFKMIMLRAFIELGGLQQPVRLTELAEKSWQIIWRRPDWAKQDILPALYAEPATSAKWLRYWLANPVQFYCKQDQQDQAAWFKQDGQYLQLNFSVDTADAPQLATLLNELIDYRLANYAKQRLAAAPLQPQPQLQSQQPSQLQPNVLPALTLAQVAPNKQAVAGVAANEIPFYPELKIACGHFGRGTPAGVDLMSLAERYGQLDAKRHFVAPAKGNSMNGGKQPIEDGDLLLLEWVTPNSAGSISNNVMAIELLDETGDATYLLRVVKKQTNGQYLLKANNPAYSDLLATANMRTFARLKAIIRDE